MAFFTFLLPFCSFGSGCFLILTIPQHFSSPSFLQLSGFRATIILASLHFTYDSIGILDK
jgi:hypothetical protein